MSFKFKDSGVNFWRWGKISRCEAHQDFWSSPELGNCRKEIHLGRLCADPLRDLFLDRKHSEFRLMLELAYHAEQTASDVVGNVARYFIRGFMIQEAGFRNAALRSE